jgi:hypothetical protein
MTDLNRVCKEANFHQHESERIGRLLVAGGVLDTTLRNTYTAGPSSDRFWQRDPEGLIEMGRQAILTVAHGSPESLYRRNPREREMRTLDLVTMFFHCFRGKALPENQVTNVLSAFCDLPQKDLAEVAEGCGLTIDGEVVARWRHWLDSTRAPDMLMGALYLAECAYAHDKEIAGVKLWWFPSPKGMTVLGLANGGPLPALSRELTVDDAGVVRAGAGLEPETLVPLFQHCVFKRLREVLEFQIDRKRLREAPADTAPGEELRRVLKGAGPLSDKVEQLLETEPRQGGKIEVRWCSALIEPENAEVLAAIRKHPQLKNYLLPKAPEGYLLIKPGSRADNFVMRCRELGFEVHAPTVGAPEPPGWYPSGGR